MTAVHAPHPAADGGWSVPGGLVVTVFSASSGSGTTTIAVNLAATLAVDRGLRVCLVDLDLAFGDLASALDLLPEATLADAESAESVLGLLTVHESGLSALLAPGMAERTPVVSTAAFDRVLKDLRDAFDVIVIDTPSAFDDLVLAAFAASDLVVSVATPQIEALSGLRLTLETLDLLNISKQALRIVLNRTDPQTVPSTAELTQSFELPDGTELPISPGLPDSDPRSTEHNDQPPMPVATLGQPLVLAQPDDPLSIAIRALAGQLVGESSRTPTGADSPRRGFGNWLQRRRRR